MNTKPAKPIMCIDVPYKHDKHDRTGRTCRNCCNAVYNGALDICCHWYGFTPARNPRARALKCPLFEHWKRSLAYRILNAK